MSAKRTVFAPAAFIALCAVEGMSLSALAADFYVSSDKSYGVAEGADPDHIFDDLQQAINAAAANDTVWVEDGFVCESGVTNATVNKTTVQTRLRVDKALTITSRSGDWRTGAVIRGEYARTYDPTKSTRGEIDKTKSGEGAVSCVVCASKSVLFRGFRVTSGATINVDKFGGGAQSGTFTNCLFSGCASYNGGGGLYSSTAYDCVISNCCAAAPEGTIRGGGAVASVLRRCLLVDCYASGQAGGTDDCTVYDSTYFRCKSVYGGAARKGGVYRSLMCECSASNSGGAGYQGYFYDCIVSNCTADSGAGGAASMYVVSGTLFVENGGSGVLNVGNSDELITNCTVIARQGFAIRTLKVKQTSGEVVDCTLVSLNGVGVQIGNDNGDAGIRMRRCTVTVPEGQYAVQCVMSTKYPAQTRVMNAWDCTFNGGLAGCGNYYNCQVSGAAMTDALINNNVQTTVGGEKVNQPINLYNCTVSGNRVAAGTGVVGFEVNAVNTILRGNSLAESHDRLVSADHCCLEDDAAVGDETACLRADPLLLTGDDGFLYPSEGSPCRVSGSLTAYALPETDLAGQSRTSVSPSGETVVAIGACEFNPDLAGAEIVATVGEALAPATGMFSASCSGLGTDALVYYWDFNSDGKIDVVGDGPTCDYYYGEAGSFTATLYVSNAVKGVKATLAMEIPEGYYVNKSGVYIHPDGSRHTAYTNLQEAVDAAPEFGTVWLDDGYVCDDGVKVVGSQRYRIYVNKALTLSSRTGALTDGGPIIRGAYQVAGALTKDNAAEKCGPDAVACVRGLDKAKAVLVGIRLESGATRAVEKSHGGGAYTVTLRNCAVSDCVAAECGGGAYSCNTEGCTIENCIAAGSGTNHGGGVREGRHTNDVIIACHSANHGGAAATATCYDCVFSNCTAATYGGLVREGSCIGCTFVGGTAGSGGGAAYKATLRGCTIIGCGGPAVYSGSVYDSRFVNNVGSTDKGSAFVFGDNGYVLSNCVFVANGAKDKPVVSVYSATTSARIIDCVFSNNVAKGITVPYGGARLDIDHCWINCTNTSCRAVATAKNSSKTALNRVIVRNSVIEGPVSGCGEYYNCRIGGAKSTLSATTCDEAGATYSGELKPLVLVNCTVTGNENTKTAGGASGGYVVAVNSIIRGNTGKAGTADAFFAATNSCLEATAVVNGEESGCVRVNPRFHREPELKYIPRVSALRGKSVVFDWMSDPEDIRSVDLRGEPRLCGGTADIGAYQMLPPVGLMLMVR